MAAAPFFCCRGQRKAAAVFLGLRARQAAAGVVGAEGSQGRDRWRRSAAEAAAQDREGWTTAPTTVLHRRSVEGAAAAGGGGGSARP